MPVSPDSIAAPPGAGNLARPPQGVDAAGPASAATPTTTAVAIDEQRLAQIYGEHHAFVWRSIVRLGVDQARAPDAVHDVFMVVARRLAEYEGRATMRTWLFAIAMRVAQAARRDAAREQRHHDRLRDVAVDSHAPHDGADAARMLAALLDRLDDDQRAVFIMAELEGMTAPEIAAATQTKIPTVYSRLRLAKEALARHAARMGNDSTTRTGGRR